MTKKAVTCPECGTKTGANTGIDTYKHAVNCFHLPAGDAQRLIDEHKGREDERSKRIVAMLSAATQEE